MRLLSSPNDGGALNLSPNFFGVLKMREISCAYMVLNISGLICVSGEKVPAFREVVCHQGRLH